jgi:hypothetical protein
VGATKNLKALAISNQTFKMFHKHNFLNNTMGKFCELVQQDLNQHPSVMPSTAITALVDIFIFNNSK